MSLTVREKVLVIARTSLGVLAIPASGTRIVGEDPTSLTIRHDFLSESFLAPSDAQMRVFIKTLCKTFKLKLPDNLETMIGFSFIKDFGSVQKASDWVEEQLELKATVKRLRWAMQSIRKNISGVGLNEPQKCEFDRLMFGESFMVNGKRVAPDKVCILNTPGCRQTIITTEKASPSDDVLDSAAYANGLFEHLRRLGDYEGAERTAAKAPEFAYPYFGNYGPFADYAESLKAAWSGKEHIVDLMARNDFARPAPQPAENLKKFVDPKPTEYQFHARYRYVGPSCSEGRIMDAAQVLAEISNCRVTPLVGSRRLNGFRSYDISLEGRYIVVDANPDKFPAFLLQNVEQGTRCNTSGEFVSVLNFTQAPVAPKKPEPRIMRFKAEFRSSGIANSTRFVAELGKICNLRALSQRHENGHSYVKVSGEYQTALYPDASKFHNDLGAAVRRAWDTNAPMLFLSYEGTPVSTVFVTPKSYSKIEEPKMMRFRMVIDSNSRNVSQSKIRDALSGVCDVDSLVIRTREDSVSFRTHIAITGTYNAVKVAKDDIKQYVADVLPNGASSTIWREKAVS